MRASNEIVVSRADFVRALTVGPRLRRRLAEAETLLYRQGGGLVVEAPTLTAEIDAAGHWEIPVAVNAGVLRRLVGKLPRTETLTLLFVADQLHVGPTSIAARNASVTPDTGATLDTERDESGQLLLPSFAPVCDRARLQQRAKAPLRARRR